MAWHKWVGSKDMGPWLSKSAQDFIFLRGSGRIFSSSVYQELIWDKLHVDYVELVYILKLGRNPLVCVLAKQL